MYWSETKDGKICRRNPPSNSLGNNRRQDQIFDSQLLFMGHLLIGILTFGTKRGSEKFSDYRKVPYSRGEKHSICTIKIGKFWGENWLPKGWTEKVLKLLSMKLMPFNPTSIVGGCINGLKIFYSHDILEYQFYWIYYTW